MSALLLLLNYYSLKNNPREFPPAAGDDDPAPRRFPGFILKTRIYTHATTAT